MKLHTPPPPEAVVRIMIKQQGSDTEYLTLTDCTKEEAHDQVKAWIQGTGIGPFEQGRSTNIQFREALGSENGKSISLTFKGLTPLELKELIILHLTTNVDAHT